jgi:hypothetical protein
MSYVAQIPRVFTTVGRNSELRRVAIAFAAFNGGEWGVWIAMLVYAYERGGATEAGVVAVVQLAWGYVAQTIAMAATAAALFAHAPAPLAYALAAVGATLVTITRPTQAALLPGLSHSPEELTATNVVLGWVESAALLVAPAVTGVLLAVGSPAIVFVVMAALVLAGALVVTPIEGPPPAAPETVGPERADEQTTPALLIGLLGAQYLVIGALDVLFVVLAIGVLGLGGSGAGYLNAAFGAGGTVGIAATVALVGRKRVGPPLALGAAALSGAFVLIGIWQATAATFVLLVLAGAGRSLFDVAGRTLLQRTVPAEVLARSFGVLEALSMGGLAVGSLLVPLVIAISGPRAACIALGLLLPVGALLAGGRLLALDRNANVPIVEISLLRSMPLFSPLGAPTLESLGRAVEDVEVEPGRAVIRTGERGDRFYAIADGSFEVLVKGKPVAILERGNCFGEIALLRDIPRVADVVALTSGRLLALGKDDFVASVTGHPAALAEAERLVRERLPAEATIAP